MDSVKARSMRSALDKVYMLIAMETIQGEEAVKVRDLHADSVFSILVSHVHLVCRLHNDDK